VSSFDDMDVDELLDCLDTDIRLLESGEWIPDRHSCDASLEVIARIRELTDMSTRRKRQAQLFCSTLVLLALIIGVVLVGITVHCAALPAACGG